MNKTSDSSLNFLQQELGNTIPVEYQLQQNLSQGIVGRKSTRRIHPQWEDYNHEKKFPNCKCCGYRTKSPFFIPSNGLPPEDPGAWGHYKKCCTCINLKSRHGFTLTYEDRVKLDAKPWCGICGTQEDLVVDHCHETNRIRGYLCDNHNKAIGSFNDNVTELYMAIDWVTPPNEITD